MQTLKTNYKYYLANGECVEYSLSPDSSLLEVIDGLATSYYSARQFLPREVWLRPKLFSDFKDEVSIRYGSGPQPTGMQTIRLWHHHGSFEIVAKSNLEFPIFIGSEQELKDNSFNISLEKILCA